MVQLFTKYVASFLYMSTEASAGPGHPGVSSVPWGSDPSAARSALKEGHWDGRGACAQICLAAVGEMV